MSSSKDDFTRDDETSFDERELDKNIRQIVDRERANYQHHGESARGIPSELKRIIDQNVERV